ncbi:serine/threonine-protein kinase [Deinococcus sp. Marseille-Q6407]|uniref:serine/threonine-protein kinase n=1 Tax=Deinococcus sp. Marseille-Q6407 TaxID=2969223 RepID=UPI0021BEB79E|nr:serine/threonine-protein kinase [Deinococcus sp. Marseille-Q6407]
MALAGRQLEGGIRLVRPVGNGSHSVAYLAVTASGQPCTVKLFQPQLLDHAQRELEVGSRFRHPRLSRVGRLTWLDDYPALVMSWVPGETLLAHYRRRPALRCEPYAYLTTLADVLDGLDHMHQLGMLHRDVKPDNILVQPSGRAILVDYDLSGPLDEPLHARVGTPAFQSPEAQAGGELGTASDLYGVGLLLYWGLWGALPEPDPDTDILDLDALAPEAELSSGSSDVCPEPFFQAEAQTLIRQLLQPRAQGRPASAAAVRGELLNWREELPAPAAQPAPPLRLDR